MSRIVQSGFLFSLRFFVTFRLYFAQIRFAYTIEKTLARLAAKNDCDTLSHADYNVAVRYKIITD